MTIDDIQKYNKRYDENSKLNEMSFKDDINYVIQLTSFQLQFTKSFLNVNEYSQNAKVELFKKNVSRTKNNIHQRQNQSINFFFFMNVIDYSFAK